MMTSGGAEIVEASDKVIEKGREMASYVLEAASIWITAYRGKKEGFQCDQPADAMGTRRHH